MWTKFLPVFGTVALGLAFAASTHHMTVNNPLWINGHELKPGDYKLQVEGSNVMIKGNDTDLQIPAKVQTAAEKYPHTSLRSESVNGKQLLEEVDLGGTKTSILLQTGAGGTAGGQ